MYMILHEIWTTTGVQFLVGFTWTAIILLIL
jgi:hypothetical protein